MSIEDLAERLSHHESASQKRFETLHHAIKEKGYAMSDSPHVRNVFEPVINPMGMGGYGGYGAGAGGLAGAGAGVVGGLLGGALLNNGGLFGRNGNGEGCVTPTQLTAALAGVQDQNSFSALMQGQARLEGLIPSAEGAMQLALAQSQGQVMNQIGQQSLAIAQGFGNAAQQTSQAQAAIVAVGESIKDSVNLSTGAIQLSIANNTAQGLQNTSAIMTAVRDDGDKTRALIVAQNESALRGEITALQIKLQEQQAATTARGVEVNVSQNVNQQQFQLQAQAQWIQVGEALRNLTNDIQSVRTTQSQIVFGNNTGSGQNSNATNNRVN